MSRFIWWIVKKLVTFCWQREHFLIYSWGVDEHVDLYVLSEESYLNRHRFGLHEEKYKEQKHDQQRDS